MANRVPAIWGGQHGDAGLHATNGDASLCHPKRRYRLARHKDPRVKPVQVAKARCAAECEDPVGSLVMQCHNLAVAQAGMVAKRGKICSELATVVDRNLDRLALQIDAVCLLPC